MLSNDATRAGPRRELEHVVSECPMPLVSVVVPTRNSSRTLEECLRSISEQTWKNLELIVVDNHSTDSTAAIAGRYADKVKAGGPERSAQRNIGARAANGEFLMFVDSDMVLPSTVIAQCLKLRQETNAHAIIVPESTVGEGFWAHCRALERSCYSGDDLIEAPRFFLRSAFDDVGGFDESLTGPEDWDLMIRVSQSGDTSSRRLPRTGSQIVHLEGRIKLRSWLRKKRYYAASFSVYWRKHPAVALRQGAFFLRGSLLRNWRRLMRHPILTAGIITLKTLELTAGIEGLLLETARVRRLRRGAVTPSRKR